MTEHLLTASDPVLLDLEVPFVWKKSYKIGDFAIYPTHRGFSLNADGFLSIRPDQYDELPSLLQEWLYFGLIKELLGRNLNIQELVRTNSSTGREVICTMRLPMLVQECRRRIFRLKKESGSKICDAIFSCTTIAAFQCRCIDQDREWTKQNDLPSILLSIRLLIDSLIISTEDFDDSLDTFTKHHRLPLCKELGGTPPSTAILLDHMIKSGWCLHQAHWFCERYTYVVVWYLASIRRNSGSQSHQGCELQDHCVANNTNPASYQCRHAIDGCKCNYFRVNIEDIKAIIRDGEIPLISFTETPLGGIQHKVIRAKYSTKYTAISHLWSDGMGNPRDNSLPRCQVANLIQRVREAKSKTSKSKPRMRLCTGVKTGPRKSHRFSHSVNIWMDTLCIPVNDENLRMKAINRMTPIFKRATRVLVIDTGLKWASTVPTTLEVCGHLNISAWSGRSWTLQEGALAAELLFPVPDCKRLPSECKSREMRYIHGVLHKAHQLPSVGRWEKEKLSQVRESQFLAVWNALLGRTTTMEKDVHGIFANLLDFHAEEILSLDPENRMKTLLCSQSRLPLKLLYDQSPRQFADGPFDRWLPDFPKGLPIPPSDSWMDVTDEGLLIKPEDVCGRTIMIMHEPRTTRLGKYCFDIEGWGKLAVSTPMRMDRKYAEVEFDQTLIHLDKDPKHLLTSGLRVIGASFAVSTASEKRIEVVFDDPIILKPWDQVSQDPSFRDCPCLNATLLANSQGILIDINIESAYKARFRRKPNLGLTISRGVRRWVSIATIALIGCCFTVAFTVEMASPWVRVAENKYSWAMLTTLAAFSLICPGMPLIYFTLRAIDAVLCARNYRKWLRSYDELDAVRKRQLSW